MLDLFSCKRKSGDGLVRYFQVMPTFQLGPRCQIALGGAPPATLGGVFDLGSRAWAGRDPEKSAQHAISMLGANAPLEGRFPCMHLGCALEREIEDRPWSMACA